MQDSVQPSQAGGRLTAVLAVTANLGSGRPGAERQRATGEGERPPGEEEAMRQSCESGLRAAAAA